MRRIIRFLVVTIFILSVVNFTPVKAKEQDGWQNLIENLGTNEEVELYKKQPSGNDRASSKSLQANIKTRRIPAGTRLKLRIEVPVNSHNSKNGDSFMATVVEDVKVDNEVVIPSQTIIRGMVENIIPNKRFSRDARLKLKFDHLVTPVGRQIPLNMRLAEAEYVMPDGTIKGGNGYLGATKKNIEQCSKVVVDFTQAGVNFGQKYWGGVPVIVTAPVTGVTGITASSALFMGESVYYMFKKGNQVILSSGKVINVILKENLDIPLD